MTGWKGGIIFGLIRCISTAKDDVLSTLLPHSTLERCIGPLEIFKKHRRTKSQSPASGASRHRPSRCRRRPPEKRKGLRVKIQRGLAWKKSEIFMCIVTSPWCQRWQREWSRKNALQCSSARVQCRRKQRVGCGVGVRCYTTHPPTRSAAAAAVAEEHRQKLKWRRCWVLFIFVIMTSAKTFV